MALMWRYKGYQVPDHIAHWVEEDPAKRMTRIDTGCDRPVMGLWLTFGRPSDSPLRVTICETLTLSRRGLIGIVARTQSAIASASTSLRTSPRTRFTLVTFDFDFNIVADVSRARKRLGQACI